MENALSQPALQNDHRHLKLSPDYPRIPLVVSFSDKRGIIQNVVTDGVKSVVVITSKAGSERASHVHEEDDHICYVVQGEIDYYFRDVGDTNPPKMVKILEGGAFYTPPHVEHTMAFVHDTIFLTLSRQSRTPEEYEADLTRIPSLAPKMWTGQ